jgi:hypothetical protein
MTLISGHVMMPPEDRERMIALGADHTAVAGRGGVTGA